MFSNGNFRQNKESTFSFFSFFVMVFWWNILMGADKMHCCIYISYAVFCVLEGPIRASYTFFLTGKVRRKGIYGFLTLSALFFLAMIGLTKYDVEGNYAILKLGLGALAKLCGTSNFVFFITLITEILPTNFRQRGVSILM